jgi:hypothetical protein
MKRRLGLLALLVGVICGFVIPIFSRSGHNGRIAESIMIGLVTSGVTYVIGIRYLGL